MAMWDLGINTQIWVAGFCAKDVGLVERAAAMGFDAIEVSYGPDAPGRFPTGELRDALRKTKLRSTFCGFLSDELDITSGERGPTAAALKYFEHALSAAAEVGAEVFSGPLYAPLFRTRWISDEAREQERLNATEALVEVARMAEERGVKVALEPLNRFETDLVNTVDEAIRLLGRVGSPFVGLHLDTFHMDVEETNTPAAVARSGSWATHFHASENDRGVPGTGHIPWGDVRTALEAIGYTGLVVVEGFNRAEIDLANGAHIWRNYASDPDDFARRSLAFLREFARREIPARSEA
jgi:D-psicose/D-tagatose/L-ribulose 3-epimerase